MSPIRGTIRRFVSESPHMGIFWTYALISKIYPFPFPNPDRFTQFKLHASTIPLDIEPIVFVYLIGARNFLLSLNEGDR